MSDSEASSYMISFDENTTEQKFNDVAAGLEEKGAIINKKVFSKVMGTKMISATLNQNLLLNIQSSLKDDEISGIEPEGIVSTQ